MNNRIRIFATLRRIVAVASLSVSPVLAAPQQNDGVRTVRGTVTDENGQPLIGATVLVQGTTTGATTDARGAYSINAGTAAELLFQYLGYAQQTEKVGARTTIDVRMKPDAATALDEVVVIGYGEVKKSDLTGSVVNVKMSDVRDIPVLSVDQAMQGRIAGADIMSTSGEPGATTSIRIRGTRSIEATNEPLIVVDGVMDAVQDLNDITPADIASVSVLKDASSTAIYGSRGANGVIIITTKQGSAFSAKPSITLKADFGISMLPRRLDLMNATEFAQYRNDYALFATSDNYGSITLDSPQSAYPYPDPSRLGRGTDWVGEITRPAPYQNYNLSISGGNKKTTYLASFGYNDTQGIIDDSGLQRLTGRLNVQHKLFRWLQVGLKSSYTYQDNAPNKATIGGTNWWNAAIYLSPMIDPQSGYNPLWYSGQAFNSPRRIIDEVTYEQQRHSTNNVLFAVFDLARGLRFRTQFSYTLYQQHTYRYEPGTLPAKTDGEGGAATRSEYDSRSLLSENTLIYNYDSKSSGHHFDALLGFTGQRSTNNTLSLSGKGYMIDYLTWNNMSGIPDKENYSAQTANNKTVKMSVIGRFNYNYKKRYYLTVTGRYDGASNFARNHKWGFFPSAALKWNLKNEAFLRDARWADEISLRASVGRTGNDGISPYRSLMAMTSSTNGYLFGNSQPVAYYPSRLASDNLTWETTDMYNLALDATLFRGRLNLNVEGYVSKTSDLLLSVQEARQTGYTNYMANVGTTTNKGWELTVDSRNIQTPKFTWSTTLTVSHNRQRVDDIGTKEYITAYSSYGNNGYMMYGYVKDYPLNALWGFKYAGTWKSQEEIDRNKITKTYMTSSTAYQSLGAPRYLDIDHDGRMSSDDLVYLGSADPDLYGGLQNNFRIGNLNIRVFFVYSLGGRIYNISEQWMAGGAYTNQYRYMLRAWHPVRNPESDIPRAGSGEQIASDRYVYDASYLRLKNISLSYLFDLRKATRGILRDLTLTLSGENLYLWKYYNGFDPDVSSSNSTSTLRRVDIGAYPKPRTVTFGIQLRY